jgi:predicted amidohydrolase
MTRVAVLQLAAQDESTLEGSFQVVEEALDPSGSADLYVLPEIWAPGYFAFDDYSRAADDYDKILDFVSGLARRAGAYVHAGSSVERDGGHLYNTSNLFSPTGDLIASYRKIHLFGYGSREQQLLTPGDEVVVAETELGRLGMAVCYDLRFPEQFRRMTDMGATIFVVASAWPHPRVEAWTTLLHARAIENQAVVIAANGAGPARGASLCGRSAIVDPWGVTIAAAGTDPAELTAEVDLSRPAAARARFPQLADRRLLWSEPGTLTLARVDDRPLFFRTRSAVMAGYTARDREALQAYIDGLAEKGIEPPEKVPSYFPVGRELVATASEIEVSGPRTGGEVECALLVDDDGEIWVAAASDHTDRELEETSIPAAKQACPKPISPRVWRYTDVREHWDQLELRSFTPADSTDPYQRASVSALLHPEDLLGLVSEEFGEDSAGRVVFGGSVSSLGGGFEYHDSFRAELHDPVTGDTLVTTYHVNDISGKGA